MKIAIITSMRHSETAQKVAKELEELGHKVKVPVDSIKVLNSKDSFAPATLIRIHEYMIRSWISIAIPWADAVLLINKKDKDSEYYVGTNTNMELGVALYLQKPIITLYDYDPSTQEELRALKIPSIGGDLLELHKYI